MVRGEHQNDGLRSPRAVPSDFDVPNTGMLKMGLSPTTMPRGMRNSPRAKVARGPKGGGFRGEVNSLPGSTSADAWGRSVSVPHVVSGDRGSPDVVSIPPSARSSRCASRGSGGRRAAWGADEGASRSARSCTPSSATGGAFARGAAHITLDHGFTTMDQGLASDSRWAVPISTHLEARAASACSTQGPGTGGDGGDMQDNVKPGLVEPPWGARRSNFDHPPKAEKARRKQMYCDYLDSQVSAKQEKKLQMQQEDRRTDMTTTTGLESRYHEWGTEPLDAVAERAVYRELLSTVDFRRRAANHKKDSERQSHAKWRAEDDARFAQMHADNKQRSKQIREDLAAAWTAAATNRRSQQENEKAGTLRSERAALDRMREGLVPARRM